MTDEMTTTAATKPSGGHDIVQWPDEVVERVARAMAEAEGYGPDENSYEADTEYCWQMYSGLAKAAIEAMGGERVAAYWDDCRVATVCWHQDECAVDEYPALLIPLETSDK